MKLLSKLAECIGKLANKRILSLLILILILSGLCLYYYDNFRDHEEYPSVGTILLNYPEGKMVSVSGTVTGTFQEGFYLEDSYQDKQVKFTIISDTQVSPGDKLAVVGILDRDYRVTSSRILATPQWSYLLLLIRSFLAFFFLIYIFNRYWKFDLKNREFIRRK